MTNHAGTSPQQVLQQPYIDGQHAATSFMLHLATSCPVGDELYRYVSSHVQQASPTHDAVMRGFLREIQKRLENLS